jgi:hypothetical protein
METNGQEGNTKFVLKKSRQKLLIKEESEGNGNCFFKLICLGTFIKKRSSRMAFPGRRKPSNRLKKILRKIPESVDPSDYEDEFSPSKSFEMIKNRRRGQTRRGNKLRESVNGNPQVEFEDQNADEILKQIFENKQKQGESNIRTRRRHAFEKKIRK